MPSVVRLAIFAAFVATISALPTANPQDPYDVAAPEEAISFERTADGKIIYRLPVSSDWSYELPAELSDENREPYPLPDLK